MATESKMATKTFFVNLKLPNKQLLNKKNSMYFFIPVISFFENLKMADESKWRVFFTIFLRCSHFELLRQIFSYKR
jgi:hypothetical protein